MSRDGPDDEGQDRPDDGGTARHERTFRGISVRAAVHYLEGVGGEATDDATVRGEGWVATVDEDRVALGPSLRLTEVTVTFEGDPEVVPAVAEAFAKKAVRAGG